MTLSQSASLRVPKQIKTRHAISFGSVIFAYAGEVLTVIGQSQQGIKVESSDKRTSFYLMIGEYDPIWE